MTVGRRDYSEADMMRMQRDAEERVRDMQNRAKATVEVENQSFGNNRNWSGSQGRRQYNNSRQSQRGQSGHGQQSPHRAEPVIEPPKAEPIPAPEAPCIDEAAAKTTIVEDVMSALKLDEDYLLIIGLMLILINQRADTTLILALAYLLI